MPNWDKTLQAFNKAKESGQNPDPNAAEYTLFGLNVCIYIVLDILLCIYIVLNLNTM